MLEELRKTLEEQIKDLIKTYSQFSNLYRTNLLKVIKKYIGTNKINKRVIFIHKDKPFIGNFMYVCDDKLYISGNAKDSCLNCSHECDSGGCKIISEDELSTDELMKIIEKFIKTNEN